MINWFEIPALDLKRARQFYSRVLEKEFFEMQFGDQHMAIFSSEKNQSSGALVQGPDYKPATTGTLIYLSGGDDLSGPLARVEQAGGTVIVPKTQISEEQGFFALFIDSEGNKLALHSMA